MRFRLGKTILSLVFLAAIFPPGSFAEDRIPSPESVNTYGPLIGVWQNSEKTLEIVLWFSRYTGKLGFITENGCTAEFRYRFDSEWRSNKAWAVYTDAEGQERPASNLYTASSKPYPRGYSFDNINCEQVKNQKPRYGKVYFLTLIEDNSTLLIAVNHTGSRDLRTAERLRRADLSKEHVNQLLLTQSVLGHAISDVSSSAICSASENYVQLLQRFPAGGSGMPVCPLLANIEEQSLSDWTLDQWRVNYDELGELFYGIYNEDYESPRRDRLHGIVYVWLIQSYSEKCTNEMPPPLTTINSAWHTEVRTSSGWKYNKDHKTSSYTMPTSYAVHYKAALDHFKSNAARYLNVPTHSGIANSFIGSRECSSSDVKRLLENYTESFN